MTSTEAECANPDCRKTFRTGPSGHSPTGRTMYCSKSCAATMNNRRRYSASGLTAQQRQARRATRALAQARKRRMLLSAAPWDGVTDAEILERDRWTCGICKRRIGKTFRYPHPRSASVDHVLPLSLGGDDTQWNKRAAHLGCNIARGNTLDAQMPLSFGADLSGRQPRIRLCRLCGESLDRRGRCARHSPIYYFTCACCERLCVARTKAGRLFCNDPECRRIRDAAQRMKENPAHQRGLEAKAMHEAGKGWDEIAVHLGYSAPQYAAAAAARATGQRSASRSRPYERQPRVSA